MAYYVSIQRGARRGFLLGPYRRHGDALRAVDAALTAASKVDPRAAFDAFGTARDRKGHGRRGVLNDRLGIVLDDAGYVHTDGSDHA